MRTTLTRTSVTPDGALLWVDAGIDGLANMAGPIGDEAWRESVKHYTHYADMVEAALQGTVQKRLVIEFVASVLSACRDADAAWITVPQLPLEDGTRVHRINRAMAAAAGEWRSRTGFSGKLILPLIITNPKQIKGKVERNPRVLLAKQCCLESKADGLWTVDSSLNDEQGSAALLTKRIANVLAFHEELNDRVEVPLKIGGPYWGTNLVLWAKGLIDCPAIGLGSGFQYLLSGGAARTPSARIAIASLKRRVLCGPELWTWMDGAMEILGPEHPAHRELVDLRRRATLLSGADHAKRQVTAFYKQWIDNLAALPPAGRSMGLFQELSAAYALGKTLPELNERGPNRRPESVAQPLMLNCL